jgi:site-specific recombinase XerD
LDSILCGLHIRALGIGLYLVLSAKEKGKDMSMSAFFVMRATVRRLQGGPLGIHMDAYAGRLLEQGFSKERARDKIRLVGDFNGWLQRHRLGVADIDRQTVRRYLKSCKGHIHPGRGPSSALQLLLDVLTEKGIAREERSSEATAPCQAVEQEFERYLSQERGLSAATLANYRPFVHQLLRERFGNGPIDLAKLRATDITGFVQRHAHDRSPGRSGPMVAALRAFLRHLRHRGEITADLAACVPTVAISSYATLPKSLKAGEVDKVLKRCDRRRPTQRRDYAILLLLARLGMRAGEVASLTLDDINWKDGNLNLHGKGGREASLPLLAEVGEAIAGYLQTGRPHCHSRRLFIRQRAPRTGFGSTAISQIVRRALARAGVDSQRKGAHLFRHTLATDMLRQGASLTEIGELLRHQHPATTMIYAKVDLPALRRLAQAWPGGGR